MIILLILWTLLSFIFLINYSSNGKCYENTDNFNLFILALCFPAFVIVVVLLWIIENIEKLKK